MADSLTVQALAAEASGWFEVARRATGDTETGPREGQYFEASEVYALVLQFLEARVDELADSEEVAS